MKYFNIMKEFTEKINLNFDENTYNKFIVYMEELIKYNNNVNLTSIVDEEEIIRRHFLDSISIFNHNINKNSYICDVGTGAGFPGIPMKIIREDLKIDLIESTEKKVKFLSFIINKLNLKNINIICDRVENVSREKNNREKYDYVTSRAMSRLCKLLELSFPLLKVNGQYIAFKGLKALEELDEAKNSINILGGEFNKIIDVDEVSKLIVIDKIKKTNIKYPRNYNLILKKPL